jgi:hypothetical protein
MPCVPTTRFRDCGCHEAVDVALAHEPLGELVALDDRLGLFLRETALLRSAFRSSHCLSVYVLGSTMIEANEPARHAPLEGPCAWRGVPALSRAPCEECGKEQCEHCQK